MLIAITSEGLEPNSLVAEKFGKTPFIIFYETEINIYKSLRNPYTNLFGGAGIQTSQFIIGKNAAAVITIDIGLNPFRLLKSAGVEVYACSKIQVQEASIEFKEGKLQKVEFALAAKFGNRLQKRTRRNWNRNKNL